MPNPTDPLRIVATASNEAEAELIGQRLLGEGIQSVARRATGSAEFGSSGSRDVYVGERDLGRARAVLADSQLSEEELARFSEEAGPEASEK